MIVLGCFIHNFIHEPQIDGIFASKKPMEQCPLQGSIMRQQRHGSVLYFGYFYCNDSNKRKSNCRLGLAWNQDTNTPVGDRGNTTSKRCSSAKWVTPLTRKQLVNYHFHACYQTLFVVTISEIFL